MLKTNMQSPNVFGLHPMSKNIYSFAGHVKVCKNFKKEVWTVLKKSLSQAVYFAMAFIPFRMSAVAFNNFNHSHLCLPSCPFPLITFNKKKLYHHFLPRMFKRQKQGLSFCQQCGIAKETVSLISLSQSYLQLEAEKYPI